MILPVSGSTTSLTAEWFSNSPLKNVSLSWSSRSIRFRSEMSVSA